MYYEILKPKIHTKDFQHKNILIHGTRLQFRDVKFDNPQYSKSGVLVTVGVANPLVGVAYLSPGSSACGAPPPVWLGGELRCGAEFLPPAAAVPPLSAPQSAW